MQTLEAHVLKFRVQQIERKEKRHLLESLRFQVEKGSALISFHLCGGVLSCFLGTYLITAMLGHGRKTHQRQNKHQLVALQAATACVQSDASIKAVPTLSAEWFLSFLF